MPPSAQKPNGTNKKLKHNIQRALDAIKKTQDHLGVLEQLEFLDQTLNDAENWKLVLEVRGITTLAQWVTAHASGSTQELTRAVVRIFALLATHYDEKQLDLSPVIKWEHQGGTRAVVTLMETCKDDPELLGGACACLGYLARNPRQRRVIADSHGIDAIVRAMKAFPSDTQLQCSALWALFELSYCAEPNKLCIFELGVIPDAIRTMTLTVNDESIQTGAANLLFNLAHVNYEAREEIVSEQGITVAVNALRHHPYSEELVKSCAALIRYLSRTCHRGKEQFRSLENVEPLLSDIRNRVQNDKVVELCDDLLRIHFGQGDGGDEGHSQGQVDNNSTSADYSTMHAFLSSEGYPVLPKSIPNVDSNPTTNTSDQLQPQQHDGNSQRECTVDDSAHPISYSSINSQDESNNGTTTTTTTTTSTTTANSVESQKYTHLMRTGGNSTNAMHYCTNFGVKHMNLLQDPTTNNKDTCNTTVSNTTESSNSDPRRVQTSNQSFTASNVITTHTKQAQQQARGQGNHGSSSTNRPIPQQQQQQPQPHQQPPPSKGGCRSITAAVGAQEKVPRTPLPMSIAHGSAVAEIHQIIKDEKHVSTAVDSGAIGEKQHQPSIGQGGHVSSNGSPSRTTRNHAVTQHTSHSQPQTSSILLANTVSQEPGGPVESLPQPKQHPHTSSPTEPSSSTEKVNRKQAAEFLHNLGEMMVKRCDDTTRGVDAEEVDNQLKRLVQMLVDEYGLLAFSRNGAKGPPDGDVKTSKDQYQELERLTRDNEKRRKEFQQAQEQMKKTNEKLTKMVEENGKLKNGLQEAKLSLLMEKQKQKGDDDEKNKMKQEISSWNKILDECKAREELAKVKTKEINEKIQLLYKERKDWKQSKQQLETRNGQTKAEKNQLEQQLANSKREVTSLQEQNASFQDTIKSLQTQLKQQQSKKDKEEKQRQDAEDKKGKQLQQKLNECMAQKDKFKAQADDSKKLNNELKQEIKVLTQQVKDIEQKHQSLLQQTKQQQSNQQTRDHSSGKKSDKSKNKNQGSTKSQPQHHSSTNANDPILPPQVTPQQVKEMKSQQQQREQQQSTGKGGKPASPDKGPHNNNRKQQQQKQHTSSTSSCTTHTPTSTPTTTTASHQLVSPQVGGQGNSSTTPVTPTMSTSGSQQPPPPPQPHATTTTSPFTFRPVALDSTFDGLIGAGGKQAVGGPIGAFSRPPHPPSTHTHHSNHNPIDTLFDLGDNEQKKSAIPSAMGQQGGDSPPLLFAPDIASRGDDDGAAGQALQALNMFASGQGVGPSTSPWSHVPAFEGRPPSNIPDESGGTHSSFWACFPTAQNTSSAAAQI